VDGEAILEELRPPELAGRVGHHAVHLSVDLELPDRRVGTGTGPLLGVGVAAVGGGVEYGIELPVGHEHHEIAGQVDFDDGARGAAPMGNDPRGERRLGLRTDDAVTAETGSLLEGVDDLLGAVSEGARWRPEPVARRRQSLLEGEHSGAAGDGPEHVRESVVAGPAAGMADVGLPLLAKPVAEGDEVAEICEDTVLHPDKSTTMVMPAVKSEAAGGHSGGPSTFAVGWWTP
jgi:hypothetical protein